MSFFKNMLNGNLKRANVGEDITKDIDDNMQTADIFEGGHKLTALDNIGSSLTTLWSNCALNVISSRETIEKQAKPKTPEKNKSNPANDTSGIINEDPKPSGKVESEPTESP